MRAGKLKHRLQIWKRHTIEEENGNQKQSFELHRDALPAYVRYQRGADVIRGGQAVNMFDIYVEIRRDDTIDSADRIKFDGKFFDIQQLSHSCRRDGFEIFAKVVPNES